MNRTKMKTIDDLPKVPFERVLSYLSLSDLLKCRAVSRGWYHRINCFRVKSLFCSERSICIRSRLVRGIFAQNFIGSYRLPAFFTNFQQTILSDLKRLCLCDLRHAAEDVPALFRILNSFDRLQELAIVRFFGSISSNLKTDVELNLPFLQSIRLEAVEELGRLLTLDTPRLQVVKLWKCPDLSLALRHDESVEWLLLDQWQYLPVKNLKNLRHLHVRGPVEIEPTFLLHLKHLREIQLEVPDRELLEVPDRELLEQKQRYGRADLKIYRFGCLLGGPDDPAMSSARFPDLNSAFVHLAELLTENPTKLADELPLCRELYYTAIESVEAETAVNLLKRFSSLYEIIVDEPVKHVQRFLDLLKSLDITVALWFYGDQPQDLLDRLPKYFAIQRLFLQRAPSDLRFLFELKTLKYLFIKFSVDIEFIRKIWKELPLITSFYFRYLNNEILIEIDPPKRIEISVDGEWTDFQGLNAAIQYIAENVVERENEQDSEEDMEDEDEEEDEDMKEEEEEDMELEDMELE